MWIEYNINPLGKRVGDCSVRAIAKALNITWDKAYALLSKEGFWRADMPSSDAVWGAALRRCGFERIVVPDADLDNYTADDFTHEFFKGTYVLGFGGHVATVENGCLYDAWDSLRECPQFYWKKGN